VYCPARFVNSCIDERSLTLTSATIPLTQAAAEGDATAVRTLLAEGQDVNVKTSRGQTPLILAAFFGHAGVVRVLLEAGADVRVKDSLGLTAMEWSTRRGFHEMTQLFQNTPSPETVSREINEEEGKARSEAEEARRRAAEETKRKAEQEASKRAEEEARIREEASRKKLEELRRIAEDEKPGQTISPEAPLESTASQSLKDSDIKRCPKCNRVYRSDILAYCSYDSARLLSEGDPAFSAARKPDASARPTLWVLVMITLLGSGILGYMVSNYISSERSPDAPITEKTERPANGEQDQPVIGGSLNGKETTLPNPEYPARAKREGVSGIVTVAVLVNKKGIVVSARALNGPPLLKLSAVEAARKAKFSPEKLAGQGSRISGIITYNFKL
jgi:TonB family protein